MECYVFHSYTPCEQYKNNLTKSEHTIIARRRLCMERAVLPSKRRTVILVSFFKFTPCGHY